MGLSIPWALSFEYAAFIFSLIVSLSFNFQISRRHPRYTGEGDCHVRRVVVARSPYQPVAVPGRAVLRAVEPRLRGRQGGAGGLRTLSSGLGTLVVSANPVLTAVLAAAFLGERLTWQKLAGLALGIGGVG